MELLSIITILFLVLGFFIGWWFHLIIDGDKKTPDKDLQIATLTKELNYTINSNAKYICRMALLENKYSELLLTNNRLNNRIVELEHMLKVINTTNSRQQPTTKQVGLNLDAEDLKRLIVLCHPDKHAGKTIAQEMTKKLIELRATV